MKLYKLSIMALAIAGVFTACSDDDKYVPGAESAGAFFPEDAPEVVEVKEEATTVNVPIYRTSGAAATCNLQITDPSGLFTAPSTVTFDGTATEANIVFTYDPAKLVVDEEYPVTIKVENPMAYGLGEYSFSFVLPSPWYDDEEFNNSDRAAGTYIYTVFWDAEDPDLPVTRGWNLNTPNKTVYTVYQWGYDVPLTIICDVDDDNTCSVPLLYIGYDHSSYGPCYAGDVYTFLKANPSQAEGLTEEDLEDIRKASYFDAETGQFRLYMIYYCDAGIFGNDFEYFQLDGYPEYGVELAYNGINISPDGKTTKALIQVTPGKDVEEVWVANVFGNDLQGTLNGIMDETIVSQHIEGGAQTLEFAIEEGAGSYSAVAVTRAKGDFQVANAITYKVVGASAPETKELWKAAEYVDGWILPGFQTSAGPINPFEWTYDINVLKDTKKEGIYYLEHPYSQTTSPLGTNNQCTEDYDIAFDMTDPELVLFERQPSGFMYKNNMWYIGDAGAFVMAKYGLTKAEVIKEGYNSYYDEKEGLIEVQLPVFGQNDKEDEYGYNWKDQYPTQIWVAGSKSADKTAAKIRQIADYNFGPVAGNARNQLRDLKVERQLSNTGISATLPMSRIIRK